jgi:tetratricopeptide (TPR) repeat protein
MHRGDDEAGEDLLEVDYQPVITPEDAALLESMLDFYDRFAETNATNLKLRIEAARAHRRVGDIHQRLGQFPEAETAYRRARELYERLTKESPEERAIQLALASVHNELGVVLKMMQRRNEAQRSHRRSLDILRDLHDRDPESAKVSLELVRTYNLMGYAIWKYRRRSPDDDVRLITQAEDSHRKALALVERLIDSDPMNPEYRLTLARSYRGLAPVLSRWDAEGAAEVTLNAIDILEGLVAERPTVPLYRYELVVTLSSRDTTRWGEAGLEVGRRRFQRAIELADELAREFPTVPEYASRYAYTCHKFGEVLSEQGCEEEAECLWRQAIDLRRRHIERFPEVSQFQIYRASTARNLADLLRQRGDLEESSRVLEESLAALIKLEASSQEPVFGLRSKLAENYFSLSRVLRMQGRIEQSESAWSKACTYNRLAFWKRTPYTRRKPGFGRRDHGHGGNDRRDTRRRPPSDGSTASESNDDPQSN